jgi:hypothetical protein
VRGLLRDCGYTREGIQGALGMSGDLLSRQADRPVHLRRLTGDGPLDTLIRLFLLDAAVEADVAEAALTTAGLAALEKLRMVEQSDGEVRGRLRLVPHGEILVASDLPDREGKHPDHVAGVHRPSVTLADLTVRLPVERALDMGTGCGIQAILAASHAERVIGTDVNERALAFAELNAALNGIENVEFRAGSFFEPVEGETFGLVVSNPPYVISPESEYLFRDSGLGRDRVSERLVGELPALLDEGAFGTIMVSWIQEGDDPSTRPRAWLEGSGCDAWMLHTGVEDPLTTAAGWNRDQAHDEQAYGAAIDRWVEYFRAEEIGALAYGGLILRRRSGGSNWVRSRELPNDPREQPAEHVLRLFTGQDVLAAHSDADLAGARLSLAEGVVIERRLRRSADGWEEGAELTLTEGIPFNAELDGVTAAFLTQLDGSGTLEAVVEQLAQAYEVPLERLMASGIRIAREMLELGFAVLAAEVEEGAFEA